MFCFKLTFNCHHPRQRPSERCDMILSPLLSVCVPHSKTRQINIYDNVVASCSSYAPLIGARPVPRNSAEQMWCLGHQLSPARRLQRQYTGTFASLVIQEERILKSSDLVCFWEIKLSKVFPNLSLTFCCACRSITVLYYLTFTQAETKSRYSSRGDISLFYPTIQTTSYC